MVGKLKTRVTTETVLSESAKSRYTAADARTGVRTLARYRFSETGPVYLSDNDLLNCVKVNLVAWIDARGRRIPTASNAL